MRCPDCNKFTSLTFEDPEVDSVDIDDAGNITASVRIYRTADCCGQEMKEATLELEGALEPDVLGKHAGGEHKLSAVEGGVEQLEEGSGRYAKSYFGARLTVDVHCDCQDDIIGSVEMSDKVAASAMDEMV